MLNHVISNFEEHFNSGKPYHGAVSYGYHNGTVSLDTFLIVLGTWVLT
jgi:hypothetical protein